MSTKLNPKELEGALILISCDTHELDDKSVKYHRVLPHTIRNGEFRHFILEGEFAQIDKDFPMEEFEENRLYDIDLDLFDTVEELAQHLLRIDGKNIINTLYYDEEAVIDNTLTITIFNNKREELLSTSKAFNITRKIEEEPAPNIEAVLRALDTTIKEDEKIFLHDRRVILRHLILFAVVLIVVWIMGYTANWTTQGCGLISIVSAIYITQLWWCNIPHKSLGSRLWDDIERRAKGRPWINGGALSGVVFTTLIVVVDKFCGITHNIAHYFLFFLLIALCMTCVIWGTRRGTRFTPKVETPEHGISSLSETLAKQRREMRKSFWKEFFRRLLPWNW